MTNLNQFQQTAAKTYGGGDYAYIAPMSKAEAPEHYSECGDTLFTFIMRELADDGEPMNEETARQRIEAAIRDLHGLLEAF